MKDYHLATTLFLFVSLVALSACTVHDKKFDKEFYENKPLPTLTGIETQRDTRNKIFEYENDLKACYAKVDALNPHRERGQGTTK